MFDFFKEVVEAIIDFFKYISSLNDDEFKEISKAWPAPTKTRMAKLRVTARARDAFFQ